MNRADRIRITTRQLLAQGVYPSPNAIHTYLGEVRFRPSSLNGRDLVARNEVFDAFTERNPRHPLTLRRIAYQNAQDFHRQYSDYVPMTYPQPPQPKETN